ncbi:MAG: hypothetical protein HY537_12930, partial [Deltaproteobacteria bacterium]|nr:hypothetical protein [Deltaproteobacteria bacterium]
MIKKNLNKWNIRFLEGPPSAGLKEAIQWLMLARLAILYGFLTILITQQVIGHGILLIKEVVTSYSILAAGFAFNLATAFFVERLPARWWIAGIQILFDSLIASGWIYVVGARDSVFALLFLLQILLVALVFYKRGALFAAILASVLYGALCTHAAGSYWNWGIYTVIFMMLGLVGGYLSEELLRTSQSLKEKQKK